MNLLFFQGETAHLIGLYGIYNNNRQGVIDVKVIDGILVLRKVQAKKENDNSKYFQSVSSKSFMNFIHDYCCKKGLEGLQFVEVDGTYYELYGGDSIQVRRAIQFCIENTSLTLDGGYIIYHFFDDDLEGENDEDDDV
ncbi:hypothetical protein SAMN02910317_00804 [Ruminococcaceae bacterium FB2012]|nr:hypothetical protein SAMN02910317_00804 [Ruminococcaceae bacterium FB2012]